MLDIEEAYLEDGKGLNGPDMLLGAIDEDGVPLIGYTTWGPIDLVSAGTGEYRNRYGFIYVDCHDDGTGDFSRKTKDSYYWYKKVIASNGENLA